MFRLHDLIIIPEITCYFLQQPVQEIQAGGSTTLTLAIT